MTNAEMLLRLKARTGETDDAMLSAYIEDAGAAIINKCYPYRDDVTEVPAKYQNRQLEIAVYLVNKQGAEGQTEHNENGVNRTYESASVPASMLKDIVPFGKVPGASDEVP